MIIFALFNVENSFDSNDSNASTPICIDDEARWGEREWVLAQWANRTFSMNGAIDDS